MSEAATKVPANDLYQSRCYAWTQEQARLLRERRWDGLDLANLIDASLRQFQRKEPAQLPHLEYWRQDREAA